MGLNCASDLTPRPTWISKTEEEGQRRQPGKADKEKLLDAGAIAEPEAKKQTCLVQHCIGSTRLN